MAKEGENTKKLKRLQSIAICSKERPNVPKITERWDRKNFSNDGISKNSICSALKRIY
jgi:hypothetical protein